MQMARPFDNSISGIIRYHGSERVDGKVMDTIALSLLEKMHGRVSVNAGEVLVTTSGAMRRSHNVQRVFHAATVVGQVGRGYAPIADVATCVVNALDAVQDNPEDCEGCDLRSILFPLMGARCHLGEGGGGPRQGAVRRGDRLPHPEPRLPVQEGVFPGLHGPGIRDLPGHPPGESAP